MGRGLHRGTRQLVADWDATYPNEKVRALASPRQIAGWIDDLRRDLKRGHSKSGEPISPAFAAGLEKHIERLQERREKLIQEQRKNRRKKRRGLLGKEKRKAKDVRTSVAEAFIASNLYGAPRDQDQDAAVFIDKKLERARRSIIKKSLFSRAI
jgi:hypothetical protein